MMSSFTVKSFVQFSCPANRTLSIVLVIRFFRLSQIPFEQSEARFIERSFGQRGADGFGMHSVFSFGGDQIQV
jgi:hypothetical protein